MGIRMGGIMPHSYRCLLFLIALFAAASCRTLASGTLTLDEARLKVSGSTVSGSIPVRLTFDGTVGLGAMQFRVASPDPAIRFVQAREGEALAPHAGWDVSHNIPRRIPSAPDTLVLVVWSLAGAPLPPGDYAPLAWLDFEANIEAVSKLSSSSFAISGIVAALDDGRGTALPVSGTSDKTDPWTIPWDFTLAQNYPNPFNPGTTIAFTIPGPGQTRVIVFDILGREVSVLLDSPLAAGRHTVAFAPGGLPSGIYFYRLEWEGRVQTKTMILSR
jgi:hypothetical protein